MRVNTNLFALLLLSGQAVHVLSQGDAFVEPTVISSASGVLDITLTFDYATFSGPHYTFTNTRLFNGQYPGPTIKIKAGDQVKILFENNLVEQPGSVKDGTNVFKLPDTTNLHFHGGHVPGELPSDDVRLEIHPGSNYPYETTFPSNHMPGTHWIHPHHHGSSALQVGGGALMALIVEDETSTGLPTDISNAPERIMVVHEIDRNRLDTIRNEIGDSTFSISITGGGPTSFQTVNGQYQPELTMTANQWERWRIIWGGWLGDNLNFQFAAGSDCEMQLLAKDGVYISDYPRTITSATIPTGGRADIMVRCNSAGTYTVQDFSGEPLLTASVSGSTTAVALSAFSPTYPDYLMDLTSTAASSGCTCGTAFRRCPSGTNFCVNEEAFDSNIYIHTIAFGSIVERELSGIDRHPYHHHVYPMQLVAGVDSLSDADENTYFQTGDWHDVVGTTSTTNSVTVRFSASVHVGTMMLHCHILTHEDEGTMAQELVVDGGSCACDALISTPGPTAAPVPTAPTAATPAPTTAPTAAASICFSEVSTVEVEGKGEVAMKDLHVHDKVFVGNKGDKPIYEQVYAFGHYDTTSSAEYFRIHTNSNYSNPLEMSATHLLYVDGLTEPVRADIIKPGDILIQTRSDIPGSHVVVTKVDRVTRNGAYMPLTQDGVIIVNGVKASTYVSIYDDAPGIVERFGSLFNLSERKLLHWWLAPYRFVCMRISPDLCQNNYNEDGIAKWLSAGRYIASTGDSWSFGFQMLGLCIFFSFMLACIALENIILSPHLVLWAPCVLVTTQSLCSMRTKQIKTKMS